MSPLTRHYLLTISRYLLSANRKEIYVFDLQNLDTTVPLEHYSESISTYHIIPNFGEKDRCNNFLPRQDVITIASAGLLTASGF